jgi:mono/diheme cytochrome c family protein
MKNSLCLYAALVGLSIGAAHGAAGGGDSYNLVEKGRYLATLGDCTACHTMQGKPPFSGGVAIDTPFGILLGSNITPDQQTGIGRWSFDDFQNVMSNVHSPGGTRLYGAMPYTAYTKVSRADNQAIWAYLQTLEPVNNQVETNQLPFPFNVRISLMVWNWLNFEKGEYKTDARKSDSGIAVLIWSRGSVIAALAIRPEICLVVTRTASFLQGGNLQSWVAPNITADPHVGIGKWTEEEIVQYLKTGANRFDIASGPMAEAVDNSTQHWKDEDLMAVAVYLKDGEIADSKPNTLEAEDPTMVAGKAVYTDRCSAWHTPSGEGISHLFPKLAGAPLINGSDPASLIHVVLAGNRAGSTDAAPSGPAMPSFAWNLSDENVADVLTYVRNSWGNAAPVVSSEKVRDLRKTLRGQ